MRFCSIASPAVLAAGLSVLLLTLASVSCSSTGSSGTGLQSNLDQAVVIPPAAVTQRIPPVPLGIRPRDASVLQTITQTGSQASQKSSAALVSGSDLSLSSGPKALQWGIWEFVPPAGTLQSALFTMDVSAGSQAWIAIANYDRNSWEFKGPYPALAGAKGFFSLSTGDYTSPGGSVFLAAIVFDGTSASVSQIEIGVEDGSEPTWSVSGSVTNSAGGGGLQGVSVALQGSALSPVLSDAGGNFSFSNVPNGDYTLVPTLANFTFNPPSGQVTVLNADVSGNNFVGTMQGGGPPWTVSGTIMNGGTPLAGVTIVVPFHNLATTTDAEGKFNFDVAANDSNFRLVPLLTGFSFEPNIVFLNVDSDKVQDFAATAYTVPGSVSYATHMKPLVFEPVCMNCHNSIYSGAERHGAPSDVNWNTYDGTTLQIKGIGNTRAQSGSMPPNAFHPTINLTDSQKALFQTWADGGFAQ